MKTVPFYETMWKNVVQQDSTHDNIIGHSLSTLANYGESTDTPSEYLFFFIIYAIAPSMLVPAYYRGLTITLRHTTAGKTPLDK